MKATPAHTELFADHFRDHSDSYVIIGGTATLIHIEQRNGKATRTTKDLDIVVMDLDDSSSPSPFLERFREYVKANGYSCVVLAGGKNQAYRYSRPTGLGVPAIIEIISRQFKDTPDGQGAQRVPEFDMSAIALTPELYEITRSNRTIVEIGELGKAPVSIAKVATLIVLKAHAYRNLIGSEDAADKSKAPKHILDIARLAAVLTDEDEIAVTESIFLPLEEVLGSADAHFPPDKLYQCDWAKSTKPEEVVRAIRDRIKVTS